MARKKQLLSEMLLMPMLLMLALYVTVSDELYFNTIKRKYILTLWKSFNDIKTKTTIDKAHTDV